MRVLIFILTYLISHQVVAQKVTLSGYIKDASNGETLIGATAYLTELDIGSSSNVYGFYSISVCLLYTSPSPRDS